MCINRYFLFTKWPNSTFFIYFNLDCSELHTHSHTKKGLYRTLYFIIIIVQVGIYLVIIWEWNRSFGTLNFETMTDIGYLNFKEMQNANWLYRFGSTVFFPFEVELTFMKYFLSLWKLYSYSWGKIIWFLYKTQM